MRMDARFCQKSPAEESDTGIGMSVSSSICRPRKRSTDLVKWTAGQLREERGNDRRLFRSIIEGFDFPFGIGICLPLEWACPCC